ncbi:DUF736 domain-containing protein [Sphingobium yanoikuyae]|uniref:DUF736 domain-containing protein n=1 Tax=Sphingobium yanoikuyae TaxID=13690 RepID=A0A3G2ULV5_SPHYA|nr:DUF736 domain-containing protein [Sphingobium yanoikuyae]AYO75933.1 DUF736 domain-containing protein [Sphingobium yanoikuyae]
MNIGEIRKNANGQLIGSVETLTITRTIGLRPVTSSNPRAPKYEIVALNDQRRWVAVGALFELASNSTGEIFYQGKIDDPSMAQPLYIAAFPREDGTMAVAWQRPRRRNSQLGAAEYGENDMFGADDVGAGAHGGEDAGDGLGDSTAAPPAKRGRTQAKDGADQDGALPSLVDA